jgi:hypothetical protein
VDGVASDPGGDEPMPNETRHDERSDEVLIAAVSAGAAPAFTAVPLAYYLSRGFDDAAPIDAGLDLKVSFRHELGQAAGDPDRMPMSGPWNHSNRCKK